MSDDRTRSASRRGAFWNPTLTDRQRVLLHTQPLLMLRHNWSLRDEECQRYDPLCLGMKLFDVVIDHSGFGDEVVRETVQDHLAPLLESIDAASGIAPEPERYRRVVDRLIGDLLNDSQRGESFSVEYSDFDGNGRAMETKAVIDRIVDGRLAVLLIGDEETEHVVPLDCLPTGAKPGDWLSVRLEDGELIDATVDQEETERIKRRVQSKLGQLRQRGRRFQPREQTSKLLGAGGA